MAGVIVSALYVAAQMLADVGSLRIVTLLGMSVDGGTLIYPLTFTLRDMVHKLVGVRATRALIWTAAGVNLVMAGLFWLIGRMPADMTVGPQVEFAQSAPVWRITMASNRRRVFAELLDTEAVPLVGNTGDAALPVGAGARCNGVAIPLDSLLFCWLAFGGTMPVAAVWGIVLANVLIKGAMTVVGLPLIYAVKEPV